jgi:hypothetical protein
MIGTDAGWWFVEKITISDRFLPHSFKLTGNQFIITLFGTNLL